MVKSWRRMINRNKNNAADMQGQAKPLTESPVSLEGQQADQVSPQLKVNLDFLHNLVGPNSDVVFRNFNLGIRTGKAALVVYIENMIDKSMLQDNILKPLMYDSVPADQTIQEKDLHDLVLNSMLAVSNVTETQSLDKIVTAVFSSRVVLLIDGVDKALIIDITTHDQRSITEPDAEVLVRGPREGFTETLTKNIVMIRRRLKSPNLSFETLEIGRVSMTKVSIAYIKGIASPAMVDEVKQRLQRIDIDGILESGYLEEFIEDHPYSPFPQLLHTERPDRVAASLLEGRVAILTDGTPFVLIVPISMASLLMSPEDYYERYIIGTFIRWIRYLAFAASILLPSLFIAVTTFHHEMIPGTLVISIASFRQGVPFPTLFEAFLMETTFEVLREAGTRLPRSVGQAVSIVGALVIGQSAVQAGLVSPLMVIIVAATGIASFTFPAFNLALTLRLLRFPLMLLAGLLGLFGVMFGIIMISIHVAKLRSFGMPYLSPVAPLHLKDLKDVLVRAPWWAMDQRPAGISKLNRRRQAANLKPAAPMDNPAEREGGAK